MRSCLRIATCRLFAIGGLLAVAFWGTPPLVAQTPQVEADIRFYEGSYDDPASPIIVSLPMGKLMPAAGLNLAKDIRETFHLKTMNLVSSPRVQVELGKKAEITWGNSEGGESYRLRLEPLQVENGVVHVRMGFRLNDGEESGAEFFTQLDRLNSMATRLDHRMFFLLFTLSLPDSARAKPHWELSYRTNPNYPESMIKKRMGGIVSLHVVIGQNGKAEKVTVTKSPHPDLSAAAVAAVRQWRWTRPADAGGPVDNEADVEVAFDLF